MFFMLVRTILIGFLGVASIAGMVGCERHASKEKTLETHRSLSQRLDELENDWIRLRASAEGKSEARQELEVMKDEIEEEIAEARKQLDDLGDNASAEGTKAKRSLEQAISKLKQSIEKAKKDLG